MCLRVKTMRIKIEKVGGLRAGSFLDEGGGLGSISEASTAGVDCLWLGLVPSPTVPYVRRRMLLNRELAAALIPLLQRFVDTGELKR